MQNILVTPQGLVEGRVALDTSNLIYSGKLLVSSKQKNVKSNVTKMESKYGNCVLALNKCSQANLDVCCIIEKCNIKPLYKSQRRCCFGISGTLIT